MDSPGYARIERDAADSRFPSFLQGFNRRWRAPACEAVYLCFTPDGTARALNEAVGRYGALRLYFLENFRDNPRNLVAVKRRWDPENYFHSAQSIPVE